MQTGELKEGERAELLALYQVTTQDLAFFKAQQWTLTNYALVALAAIGGIRQFSGVQLPVWGTMFLSAAAIATTLFTAWLLWHLHGSIAERRARLRRLYARFSVEFRVARGIKQSNSAWRMVAHLWVVLAIGLALVLWLLISPHAADGKLTPNPSLEGTATGKALGPPAGVVHHPASGPSALPASAPQLKR